MIHEPKGLQNYQKK